MRLVSDETWAAMTIWQEAQGESYEGKLAVAEVIRNRTRARHMSDGTVPGTCLWPVQFSGWNAIDPTPKYRERIEGAKLDDSDPIVKDCIRAWKEAMAGSDTVKGAMYYFNPHIVKPAWAREATVLATVGNHVFVRLKGA